MNTGLSLTSADLCDGPWSILSDPKSYHLQCPAPSHLLWPCQIISESAMFLALSRLNCWFLSERGLPVGLLWPLQCLPHPAYPNLFSLPYWRLPACRMAEMGLFVLFVVVCVFVCLPILSSLRRKSTLFICSSPVAHSKTQSWDCLRMTGLVAYQKTVSVLKKIFKWATACTGHLKEVRH